MLVVAVNPSSEHERMQGHPENEPRVSRAASGSEVPLESITRRDDGRSLVRSFLREMAVTAWLVVAAGGLYTRARRMVDRGHRERLLRRLSVLGFDVGVGGRAWARVAGDAGGADVPGVSRLEAGRWFVEGVGNPRRVRTFVVETKRGVTVPLTGDLDETMWVTRLLAEIDRL
jgi:hypothetical protein